jgi:very-short-patch-repair endonuclease
MKEDILKCKNKSDVCRLINVPTNGVGMKKVENLLEEYGLSLDIFNKRKMYNKNPKLCKECGKKISYDKKRNDFCDSSCSTTFTNKERDERSVNSKNKTSQKLKKFYENNKNKKFINEYIEKICPTCKETFSVRNTSKGKSKKYCSKECSLIGMRKNLSRVMKERVKKGLHHGWNSRNVLSYPEKFFTKVLKNNNLYEKCSVNHPINKKIDLNVDESWSYFLDFYFEEKKICLEIDGSQHKDRKEHDNLRDKRLENVGIKVYRIKWKSINTEKGKLYMKNEINKFLDFYDNE